MPPTCPIEEVRANSRLRIQMKRLPGEISQTTSNRVQLSHFYRADFIITTFQWRSSVGKPVIPCLDEPQPLATESPFDPNSKLVPDDRHTNLIHEPQLQFLKRGVQAGARCHRKLKGRQPSSGWWGRKPYRRDLRAEFL